MQPNVFTSAICYVRSMFFKQEKIPILVANCLNVKREIKRTHNPIVYVSRQQHEQDSSKRICRECKTVKSAYHYTANFNKGEQLYRLAHVCKECKAEIHKQYRKRKREKIIIQKAIKEIEVFEAAIKKMDDFDTRVEKVLAKRKDLNIPTGWTDETGYLKQSPEHIAKRMKSMANNRKKKGIVKQ